MAWTTPITWAVRQQLTAALMNEQVRDNLNYLNDNTQAIISRYKATDAGHSTTSTSYVDTGLTYTIETPAPATVVILVATCIRRTSGTATVRIHRNGTEIGDEGYGTIATNTGVTLLAIEQSLAAGTYTYTLKLKSSSATETAYVTAQTMLILVLPDSLGGMVWTQ